MRKMSYQRVSEICLKTGYLLINGGAESYRIEDTISRIGYSLGHRVNCYVTVTAVFIEVDGETSKFIKSNLGGTNLQMIDDSYSMSRQLASHTLGPKDFVHEIDKIYQDKHTTDFPFYLKAFGAGLVSMAPMLISTMPLYYFIYCFIVGTIGYAISYYLSIISPLPYVDLFISGFTIALLGIILKDLNLIANYHNIIIGAVMPLVPGVAITNAFRELVMRHALSGAVKLLDAVLVASSIGFGIATALIIF